MFTKSLLVALVAACATPPQPDPPKNFQPDQVTPKNQHFCCTSVDIKTASGDGCTAIGEQDINTCANVLSCSGDWVKENGDVTCIK